MSLFKPAALTCPACGHNWEIDAVDTVNADRRPDLRDAILDGTFQSFACPSCEEPVRLEPKFNYLEVGVRYWIAAFPGRDMPDYLEVEDTVTEVFARSYGSQAMPSAQAVGDDLNVRLVFGWPAMREKLQLEAWGLSDVDVELLKMDLLRRLPEAPLAPGIELRLVGTDAEMLHFVWIETESEDVVSEVSVKREVLGEITNNADAWSAVRARLTDGPFVDMQKLYMGEGRGAQAAE